jgi:hypothetical protein
MIVFSDWRTLIMIIFAVLTLMIQGVRPIVGVALPLGCDHALRC